MSRLLLNNYMRHPPGIDGADLAKEITSDAIIGLTADVVCAYVSNNPVPPPQLPALIEDVFATFQKIASGGAPQPQPRPALQPAVPIKKSVTADFIICLEDGKKFKSLKRHLGVYYGLSPQEYRAKWNLPADYPMVAANYAAARSKLAKKFGLGRKAKDKQAPRRKRKA